MTTIYVGRDECRAYATSCGISENEAREDLRALAAEQEARARRVEAAARLQAMRRQESELRQWRAMGAV